jgi:hypothetical protein
MGSEDLFHKRKAQYHAIFIKRIITPPTTLLHGLLAATGEFF